MNDETGTSADVLEWSSRSTVVVVESIIGAVAGVVLIIWGIVGTVVGQPSFGLAMIGLIWCGIAALWMYRRTSVGPQGVVIRSLLNRREIGWNEVASFQFSTTLVVILDSGEEVSLRVGSGAAFWRTWLDSDKLITQLNGIRDRYST